MIRLDDSNDLTGTKDGPALLPFTDAGNAERYAKDNQNGLRFVYPWQRWMEWDDTRWVPDESGAAIRRARQSIRWLLTFASTLEDDTQRQKLIQHALKSESGVKLRAMVDLAKSDEVLGVHARKLDPNPWYLNVANGTLDLRTGKLRPHCRADLITKLAPVEYDKTAECPKFTAFLEEILPDPDVRTFLQRAIGYSLTGMTSERCLFVLHGDGDNGKSTFLEILHAMFGDYARSVEISTFMTRRQDGGARPDLVRLVGTRLVNTVEVEEGRRLAESLVKRITGNDTIAARDLYAGSSDYVEFTPTFKVFMATNHKPIIKGTDNAIWNRIRLVPFDVTIPKERQNKNLLNELKGELPGILAWAVDGCAAWQTEGLAAPKAVRLATEQYRDEMDEVAAFLADEVVETPDGQVRAKDLYSRYKSWTEDAGDRPLNLTRFGERLKAHGCEKHKTTIGVVYDGISLRMAA